MKVIKHQDLKQDEIIINHQLNETDLEKLATQLRRKNSIEFLTMTVAQTEETFKHLNDIIGTYKPNLRFTVWDLDKLDNEYQSICTPNPYQDETVYGANWVDVSFLQWLPDIQSLTLNTPYIKDIRPINLLKKLTYLNIINNFTKKQSLSVLKDLRALKTLNIYSVRFKDIETLVYFKQLEHLTVSVNDCKNLDFLRDLSQLRNLRLINFDKVENFLALETLYLDQLYIIYRSKKQDADFLTHLINTRHLYLSDFHKITKLPDLGHLAKLQTVSLVNCKALSDISGLAKAPNLESLRVFIGKNFQPEGLLAFKNHPTLEEISAGFETQKQTVFYQEKIYPQIFNH